MLGFLSNSASLKLALAAPALFLCLPSAGAAISAVPQSTPVSPTGTDRESSSMLSTGTLLVNGAPTAFVIRRLPVSSFPALPDQIAAELAARNCMIPQTWQAHRPENVVEGSFERSGSQDWAILCSANGQTSLLVFFASGSANQPVALAHNAELSRLQPHNASGELGFNWGIDAATPKQLHDALDGRQQPNHDSIADSVIDRTTLYHLYSNGKWVQFRVDE